MELSKPNNQTLNMKLRCFYNLPTHPITQLNKFLTCVISTRWIAHTFLSYFGADKGSCISYFESICYVVSNLSANVEFPSLAEKWPIKPVRINIILFSLSSIHGWRMLKRAWIATAVSLRQKTKYWFSKSLYAWDFPDRTKVMRNPQA